MKYTPISPEVNENVVSGRNNPAVEAALDIMYGSYSEKNEQDERNRKIQTLFEEGFTIRDPRGTRKIGSKKLHQAIWRTASRMKPLDFIIQGTGRPEWAEKILSDGVATVMQRGGYAPSLRDKNGAFMKLLMYGDGFIQVGANPKKDNNTPIKFKPVSNTNVYFDAYGTAMRSANNSSSVTKCCVVFSHPWDEAVKIYPKLKKIGGPGRIPRINSDLKELERNYNQEVQLKDIVEIAYFYDISNKRYTVFAGKECTVLEDEKDEDYPFIKDKEPYIPVIQYMCVPSSKGFYNHGVGAMIYDLAIISRRLMNMEVGHIEDNVYPITLVSTAQGKASEFFQKLKTAHEIRTTGKKGYVAMEFDPNNPGSDAVRAESLLTNNLTNEWQMVYDMLDRELKRMGIFLDEADRTGNPTATQVLAEEESSNSFVKQIMEYNASESKFAIDLTLDMIEKFVTKNSKIPLNLTTEVKVGDETMRADGITLGMVKDEINKYNYFVKVNSRTGAIPSNVLQQAQISRVLQMTPQGTPAYFKLMKQLSDLNDRDVKLEEFNPPQQQTPERAPQSGGEVPEGSMPTGTERLAINPRNPMTEPAI